MREQVLEPVHTVKGVEAVFDGVLKPYVSTSVVGHG